MSSTLRKRSTLKRYQRYIATKTSGCDFCRFSENHGQFVQGYENFIIVKNIFGYDVWDSCGILDQLMIVPRRHILGMWEFTKSEDLEFMKLVKKYEKDDYNLYARAPTTTTKSVPHQHTHLIKLDNKRKQLLIYLKKPHMLWYT